MFFFGFSLGLEGSFDNVSSVIAEHCKPLVHFGGAQGVPSAVQDQDQLFLSTWLLTKKK